MPKFLTALALASLVALPLVSCSSPADAGCEAQPGPHSSQVKVTGTFGDQPTVTMPPAFDATTTERSVLVNGSGERAVEGELVQTHYAVYNASTGQPVELTPGAVWGEGNFVIDKAQKDALPGLYKSLLCSRAGDRVVSAVPPSELFGALGVDMSKQGIGKTDTVVFIFDVSKVGPAPTPTPTAAPTPTPLSLPTPGDWVDNVPTVDLSGSVPVVTLPSTPPPAQLELKVLTEGTGAEVAAMSNVQVTIDYQGISWDTKRIFDQSFGTGKPAKFPVAGVIQGFAAAIVGHKVGSTVIVSIPPKYAYGEGAINDADLKGQTLVFLITIHDAAAE